MSEFYASPINAFAHGEYRRPVVREPAFRERITTAEAVAGRLHIYGSRTSPAAHRLEILRHLAGLEDTVSLSYVDHLRDARGWAFREATGPDPVNGFTLLREAYESSRPGYRGDVSVPVLWDRASARIVSNDAVAIGVDLATQFGSGTDVYPVQLAGEIERVSSVLAASFTDVVGRAVYDRDAAAGVRSFLRRLDRHLAEHRYLIHDSLTDADVRLWVGLVRYDAGPNAHGAIGPDLAHHPDLWRYARELYARSAFGATTDFGAFAAPFAQLPAWDESASPAGRDLRVTTAA